MGVQHKLYSHSIYTSTIDRDIQKTIADPTRESAIIHIGYIPKSII